MSVIAIRVGGVEHRFDPAQQPVSIGRDPASTVVVNAQAVSSTHARLTFEGGQWVYRDQSTNGSYVYDTPAPEFSISAPVTVVLGNLEQGAVIELAPATDAVPESPPAATPMPSVAPPVAGDPYTAPGTMAPGPAVGAAGPAPTPAAGGGQQMSSVHSLTQAMPQELRGAPPQAYPGQMSGQDIRIQYAGGEFVAHPGQTVTFGRDPSNDIDLDNPTVSRRHGQLTYTQMGWQLDDLGSSRGLTVDGETTRRVMLQGTTDVWFGPEEAGMRVVFVAPGKTKKKGGLNPLMVIAPIVAVVLIALVAIVVVARSGSKDAASSTTTAPGSDLTALKKGTVRIEVNLQLSSEQRRRVQQAKKDKGTPNAPDMFGSGTIISADGLVLTNAHVAVPDQMSGTEEMPPVDTIKVVRNPEGSDEQLTETEDAELVVADPKLDLAVIRITGAQNLPAIPIGNDANIKAGDELVILGFPGTADTNSVTVTAGKVSSFVPDKKLGVDRAWINTDAKVEQGNSGGLAASRDGKIVGVPTLACFESIQTGSSSGGPMAQQNRIRSIDLAADLIAAAKSGADYEVKSPDDDVCALGKRRTG